MSEAGLVSSGVNPRKELGSSWGSLSLIELTQSPRMVSAQTRVMRQGYPAQACDQPTDRLSEKSEIETPILVETAPKVDLSATPIEIWEGVVRNLDESVKVMYVTLNSKLLGAESHTADIDMEWVAQQDRELVKPGAVFYLYQYKRMRGGIENAQEIRFRRRPSWSKAQVERLEEEGKRFAAKGRMLPLAE